MLVTQTLYLRLGLARSTCSEGLGTTELHVGHLQKTGKEDCTDTDFPLGGKLEGPDGRYGNGDDEEVVEDTNGRRNDTQ